LIAWPVFSTSFSYFDRLPEAIPLVVMMYRYPLSLRDQPRLAQGQGGQSESAPSTGEM